MIRALGKIFWMLVLAGLGIALLRAFDWDPFALIEWLWNWLMTILTRISDFFSGNKQFQEITTAPGAILGLLKL